MGQLDRISEGTSFDRFLHPYDVVCMIHTGVCEKQPASLNVSSSHVCVYMRNRPLSPHAGGHAIFVKKRLHKHVSIILDRIEHGVVWIQIRCPSNSRKCVYIGFLYLPPQSSTYYTQVDGLSLEDHLVKLQQDISFFQGKGQVMIMGDFNARLGILNEWDLLDPFVRRHYDTYGCKERVSKDSIVNSMGRKVIGICENNGVFALNGRSASDAKGAFTYKQLGGKGRSCIDYALVSRDLLLLSEERLIDFCVIPFHLCPRRHNGQRFDHCPIKVSFAWQGIKEGEVLIQNNGVDKMAMRWQHQFRAMYTDIIQTDGIVLSLLNKVSKCEVSMQESCEALAMAVRRAAEVLHEKVGGVFVKRGVSQKVKVRWLSREAREIKKRMKEAERSPNVSRTIQYNIVTIYHEPW